jgi:hypothetical protein
MFKEDGRMMGWPWRGLVALVVLLGFCAGRGPACNLCTMLAGQSLTFRQEAGQARLILYGTLENPRLVGEAGRTDVRVLAVLKSDGSFKPGAVVEIPRYVPAGPKDPPHFLIFCDVLNGKLDPYRGVPVQAKEMVAYLRGALALDPKDRTAALLYYFRYLEHPDAELANDAFLEFAKANDREIGEAAPKLTPDRLRAWLQDPQTPVNRLGLYAFLLGACGGDRDAALFRSLLQNPGERTTSALDGILGGYIQLRPQEGWALALALLRDEKKPFVVRYAVVRALRFYHGWKPEETRDQVLRLLAAALPEGDLADLAVEDLRRWRSWDLTKDVVALYGRPTHRAPILRRAILRYALCCPRPEATAFVAERRREDPGLVKEVEDALQFEKPK